MASPCYLLPMLSIISALDWLRLAGALILFLGPGLALASFHPRREEMDRTQTLAISIGFSISLWAVLLAWLKQIGVSLGPTRVAMILGLGWLVAVWRFWNNQPNAFFRKPGEGKDLNRYLLWGVICLSAIINIYALRNVVVGPGSDSYHHTLIVQLFIDQGGIPSNYLPYANLLTFKYHFGYHAFAAAIAWVSNFRLIFLTPILAQLLVAASALTTAYFTERILRNRFAALVSAIFVGLVMVFPAYMINWGRYTQLAGLVLLPLLLAEFFNWDGRPWNMRVVLPSVILASGIALTHYRVALMALIAAIILWLWRILKSREKTRADLWRITSRPVGSALLSLMLVSPWLIESFANNSAGYVPKLGAVNPSFFSLQRLGEAIHHPTNIIVLILLVFAIVKAVWRREPRMLLIVVWSASIFVLSFPTMLGSYMDTVTTTISLYLSVAILIGFFSSGIKLHLERQFSVSWGILALSLALLVVRGSMLHADIVEPGAAYVTLEDLEAMEWINANTPDSTLFATTTFEFGFLPGYIIGVEGGSWIPLLAERATLVPPMIYPIEHSLEPSLAENLLRYHRIQDRLETPEGLSLLEELGITHLYLGNQWHQIPFEPLNISPNFELVYSGENVWIFEYLANQKR